MSVFGLGRSAKRCSSWLPRWMDRMPDAPVPPFWLILILCAAYLAFVFGGERYMRNRNPIVKLMNRPLDKFQVAHNMFMFVYSLCSTLIMGFGIVCMTSYKSFNEMICDGSEHLFTGFNSWILFFFLISKMWEFVDTVFLVLGKHRIRFLHVYHHVITLPLAWVLYADHSANGTICAWANMFVHTPMYYYYTMKSLGRTVWWKKYITQIQITQFVICMLVMLYDAIFLRRSGSTHCRFHKKYPYHSIIWSALIYLSFLVLFIMLYIENYKNGENQSPQKGAKSSSSSSRSISPPPKQSKLGRRKKD